MRESFYAFPTCLVQQKRLLVALGAGELAHALPTTQKVLAAFRSGLVRVMESCLAVLAEGIEAFPKDYVLQKLGWDRWLQWLSGHPDDTGYTRYIQ